MTQNDRRVVAGFKLPGDGPITENEQGWIEFLRIVFNDEVPPPTPEMRRRLAFGVPPPVLGRLDIVTCILSMAGSLRRQIHLDDVADLSQDCCA